LNRNNWPTLPKTQQLTDTNEIPLAVVLTCANSHDVNQLLLLVDGIRPIRGKQGRPEL
jgi:hypothetical protein